MSQVNNWKSCAHPGLEVRPTDNLEYLMAEETSAQQSGKQPRSNEGWWPENTVLADHDKPCCLATTPSRQAVRT